MDANWVAHSYATFFGQVAIALPLAVLGAWVVGLIAPERAYLRTAILRRLGRVPKAKT